MPRPTADLIGTSAAARILDVNPATVTRWVADGVIAAAGKLPSKNGAFLFNRNDVEALAASRAAVPAAAGVSQ